MAQLLSRLSQGNALLAVAAGLGVVTALLVFVALSGSEPPPPQVIREQGVDQVETQVLVQGELVVVARDLVPAGTSLTEAFLKQIEIPAGTVPAGAFTQIENLVGRVTRFPLAANEQVLEHRLVSIAPGELRDGLAFSIPPGLRAMGVLIDNPIDVLLVPGDRIDILITTFQKSLLGPEEVPLEGDPPPETPTVYTLMQNIFVLGTGTSFTRPPEAEAEVDDLRAREAVGSGGTIILAVTPKQAQQLLFALDQGVLSLTLRRFGDHSEAVLDPEYRITPSGVESVTGSTFSR